VEHVAALGHVGGQAAVKVAVGEARDLPLKGHAQAGLEPAAQPELGKADRQLEQEDQDDEGGERTERRDPLARETELGRQLQQPSEEQGFDHDCAGCEEERGQHGRRREEPLGGQVAE
jgi:hypothetical protein